MLTLQTFAGQHLTAVLNEPPLLSLDFYSYGVMLRKREGDILTEYAVDPAQVATALAAKVAFDTGLLDSDTLLVRQEGVKKTVVSFRKAQKTGLYLEGTESALRIPLPPLLLIRETSDSHQPHYQIYAVKQRPLMFDEPLFHAPLPNIFDKGGICWGNVPMMGEKPMQTGSLAQDWTMLLGSRFGDHGVHNKSRRFQSDIRQMFIDLETRKARVYPKSDLIPTKRKLSDILEAA